MTLYNLVRQVSTTTGDSDLTLGAAVAGCLTMALAGVSDSEDVYYGLITYSLSTRLPIGSETGTGRYISSGPTFKRTTVETSTDSDNTQIDCTGYTEVYITPPASYFNAFLGTKAPVMWHDQSAIAVGNALTYAVGSTVRYGYVAYQNAAQDSDEWTNGFACQAGTYTLKLLSTTDNNRGKLDVYIDNTLQGTINFYSSSLTENVEKSLSSITLSAGYHTLKGKVNGSDSDSGGYLIALSKIWLVPASY